MPRLRQGIAPSGLAVSSSWEVRPRFSFHPRLFRFAFLDSRSGVSSTLYPSGGDSPLNRRNSIAPCSNSACTTAPFASFLLRKSAGTVQGHFSCSSGCPVSLSVMMHRHAGDLDAYKSSVTHHHAAQIDHTYHHDLLCVQTYRVAHLAKNYANFVFGRGSRLSYTSVFVSGDIFDSRAALMACT
jgi:hypothetical protein